MDFLLFNLDFVANQLGFNVADTEAELLESGFGAREAPSGFGAGGGTLGFLSPGIFVVGTFP